MTVEDLAPLPHEETDFSDVPELGDEFFRDARLVMPTGKTQLALRIDMGVVSAQGKGYQSRMNAVLRAYVATQREGRGAWRIADAAARFRA